MSTSAPLPVSDIGQPVLRLGQGNRSVAERAGHVVAVEVQA